MLFQLADQRKRHCEWLYVTHSTAHEDELVSNNITKQSCQISWKQDLKVYDARRSTPMSLSIENWYGTKRRDNRWHLKARHMRSFVQKVLVDSDRHKFAMAQNAWKRCCWHCNIWRDWFTSHQPSYNGILEFMRKCSMLTLK